MRVAGSHEFAVKPVCPHCGRVFDACNAAGLAGRSPPPNPGDFSACTGCGAFAVFADGAPAGRQGLPPEGRVLSLRPMTDDERAELEREYGFQRALAEAAVRDYRRAAGEAAIRHAMFHLITGRWPEDCGIEDPPITL